MFVHKYYSFDTLILLSLLNFFVSCNNFFFNLGLIFLKVADMIQFPFIYYLYHLFLHPFEPKHYLFVFICLVNSVFYWSISHIISNIISSMVGFRSVNFYLISVLHYICVYIYTVCVLCFFFLLYALLLC